MKILIAHELFPPDVAGGGEKVVLKLASSLIDRGHEVKIFTSGIPKVKEFEGIETIRIPVNRYILNLSAPLLLKHAKDFDLIQTSSGNLASPSYKVSRILKKPVVCTIHHLFGHYWRDVRGPVFGRFFELGEKFYLKKDFDAFVFENNYTKKLALDIGIDKKKIHLIPPGFDHEKITPKQVKKEPFVLFIGNFSMNDTMIRTKGLDYLIEAARKLPEMKFVVVGGGNNLEKLKKSSPKNIKFTGPLQQKELFKILNKAMIFCLPSLSEGFGLSILEAMSFGCAIVSTIDLGQEEVMIRTKNVDDIVNAINNLAQNPKKNILMGKKNVKIAKKFTWKKFIDGYENLYKNLT